MVNITLSNGIRFENLEVNGSYFVRDEAFNPADFDGITDVVIDGDTALYPDGYVIDYIVDSNFFAYPNGKHGVAFTVTTEEERTKKKLLDTVSGNYDSITDLQIALAEVYELILG